MPDSTLATIAIVSCPICGGTDFGVLGERRDGIAVVQCARCRMGVVAARPLDPLAYYSDAYYSHQEESDSGYSEYRLVAAHSLAWVSELIHILRAGGKVLDVGCADGHLLKLLGPAFARHGIEVNERFRRQCRRAGIRILGADITDRRLLADHAGTFDVITAIAVLEHVGEMRTAVERIRELLAPQGVLIFEVPLISPTQPNSVWFNSSLEHIYYPTIEGLQFLFETVFQLPLLGREIEIRDYGSTFVGVATSSREKHAELAQLFPHLLEAPVADLASPRERSFRVLFELVHAAAPTADNVALLAELEPEQVTAELLHRLATLWRLDLTRGGNAAAAPQPLEGAEVGAHDAGVGELRSALAEQLADKEELLREAAERDHRLQELQATLAELLAREETLRREVGDRDARLHDLDAALAGQLARQQELRRERVAREEDLLREITTRDGLLREVMANLAEEEARNEGVLAELDERDARLAGAQAEFEARDARLAGAQAELEARDARLEGAQTELAARAAQLAGAQAELERTARELELLRSSKSWRLVVTIWRLRAALRLRARAAGSGAAASRADGGGLASPALPPAAPEAAGGAGETPNLPARRAHGARPARLGAWLWGAARLGYRLLPLSGRRRHQLRRKLLAWLSVPDDVPPEVAVERLRDLAQALSWRRLGAVAKLLLRGNLPALKMHANLLVQHTVNQQTREAAFLGAPGEFVVLDPQPWPSDQPLVSVIIPCYNYGHFVAEAVDSVLAQTFRNFEILVVDGGSDPASLAHLRGLERPQTRIFFREGRHFVGDNRNFGIDLARGKYVCCLDADDRIQPTYLEKALFLLETQDYDLVSCSFRCFGDSSAIYHLERFPGLADMLQGNQVSTCAVFRKQLWSRAGGFQDAGIGGDYIYEDWRLWVRCAALGARFANIVDEPLLWYRVHSAGSLSSQNQAVPPMDRQRQAMAEFNRDVLTEEAYRQSEENRRRQVRMHDGLVNLRGGWPPPDAGAPVILIAMPFLVIGGAERLISAVAGHLARRGFRIVVVTTEYVYPTYGDATPWFATVTSEIYHLPRFLEPGRWQEFIFYLIETRRPSLMWIIGSRVFYELLPKFKEVYPELPVIDLLFNTIGHTASNRKYAQHFDRILVENREVAAWLENAGERPERVRQIPSGVDLAEYRPPARRPSLPAELGIEPAAFVAGFSGRLSEEKDPDTFLEIARRCRGDARIVFLLTGAGPQAEQIHKRVDKLALGNRLHFLGQVDEVKDYMAAYDVLVLPSRFDGRPVAVLESLALGVPVVASRVGALPELIRDGVNGFLCEPGDAEGFAERIRWLANHPREHRRMKLAARRFAEAELGAGPMFEAYEQAIRELIEPSRVTLAV